MSEKVLQLSPGMTRLPATLIFWQFLSHFAMYLLEGAIGTIRSFVCDWSVFMV